MKMATPASRESVGRLRTFLVSLLIVSWLYPSAKLFTYCTSESIEFGFSLKIMIFFRRPYRWHGSNLPCLPLKWWSFAISKWWLLPQSTTKHCLSEAVVRYDTFFFAVDVRMTLQPIVQMQFSHFSMRSFEAESSAERQQTRGQRTVRTSASSTSIFERCANSDF